MHENIWIWLLSLVHLASIRSNVSSAAMIKESGQEFASTLAMLSKRKTNAQIPGFEGGVLVRSYGDSEVETLNPRHIVT